MRLLSLSLEQFRNYEKLSLEVPPGDLHLLLGENGSGKTNVLEAIALLSLAKSFLGLEEEDLRQWGSEFYRVKGIVEHDAGEKEELEIVSQWSPRRAKACFRNGVRTPLSEMVGRFPAVAFLPQDLSLFSGPPSERRRTIDQLLSQTSREYFHALLEYQRCLKQRNTLLRTGDSHALPDALEPWDAALAEKGSLITLLRFELMETFNLTLQQEITALGEEWNDTRMLYQTTCEARTAPDLRAELLRALKATRERDILIQSTSVGPHRDDWTVTADGRPLFSFASRGQQRVAVLALLFLEASYLEVRRGEKPVILLDDVFSELDADHRERVLTAFSGHQMFLTATEMPVEAGAFRGTVSRVEQGTLRRAQGDKP